MAIRTERLYRLNLTMTVLLAVLAPLVAKSLVGSDNAFPTFVLWMAGSPLIYGFASWLQRRESSAAGLVFIAAIMTGLAVSNYLAMVSPWLGMLVTGLQTAPALFNAYILSFVDLDYDP